MDIRKEIIGKLEDNKKCPKCGSYYTIKIKGLKEMHVGGDDWCKNCGHIGEEWTSEKR